MIEDYIREKLRELNPGSQISQISKYYFAIDKTCIDCSDIIELAKESEIDAQIKADNVLSEISYTNNYANNLSKDEIYSSVVPRLRNDAISPISGSCIDFLDEIKIYLCLNFEQYIQTLPLEMIDKYKLDVSELDIIARNNIPESVPQIVETIEGPSLQFHEQDGLDSSRLLLPNLWDMCFDYFKGDFYVFIPGRDIFIATKKPLSYDSRQLVFQNSKAKYPIALAPFYITKDGIVYDK